MAFLRRLGGPGRYVVARTGPCVTALAVPFRVMAVAVPFRVMAVTVPFRVMAVTVPFRVMAMTVPFRVMAVTVPFRVMAGLGPATHDFASWRTGSRGWPGQARP
jgi:hypothetical protein